MSIAIEAGAHLANASLTSVSSRERSTTHLGFADEFRAFAILIVIGSHCVNRVDWGEQLVIHDVLRSILKNGSFYFVFVSGFLFQHLIGKFSPGRYYASKAKFVILPYVLVSLPAIVFLQLGYGHTPTWFAEAYGAHSPLPKTFLYLVTSAHSRHTWYILMAAILFMLAPAFRALDRRRVLFWIVWLPALAYSLTHTRGSQNADHTVLLRTAYYFSVYLFGMLASRHYEVIVREVRRFGLPLVAFAVVCTVFHLEDYRGRYFLHYLQKGSISLLLIAFLPSIAWGGATRTRITDYFASRSFALFFVHYFIADAMTKKSYGRWMKGALDEGLLSCLLLFAVVLSLSMLVVEAVKLIAGRHSRYAIGA